jgi:glycosylphosphatidylinositol transamidase
MITASALVRKLRQDPYFLFARLPPIISLICIVVGVVTLLLLPLDEYSRNTYISENALLPGQVHTYFSGSEQNIFRGYKRELESLLLPVDGGDGGGGGEYVETAPAYVNM